MAWAGRGSRKPGRRPRDLERLSTQRRGGGEETRLAASKKLAFPPRKKTHRGGGGGEEEEQIEKERCGRLPKKKMGAFQPSPPQNKKVLTTALAPGLFSSNSFRAIQAPHVSLALEQLLSRPDGPSASLSRLRRMSSLLRTSLRTKRAPQIETWSAKDEDRRPKRHHVFFFSGRLVAVFRKSKKESPFQGEITCAFCVCSCSTRLRQTSRTPHPPPTPPHHPPPTRISKPRNTSLQRQLLFSSRFSTCVRQWSSRFFEPGARRSEWKQKAKEADTTCKDSRSKQKDGPDSSQTPSPSGHLPGRWRHSPHPPSWARASVRFGQARRGEEAERRWKKMWGVCVCILFCLWFFFFFCVACILFCWIWILLVFLHETILPTTRICSSPFGHPLTRPLHAVPLHSRHASGSSISTRLGGRPASEAAAPRNDSSLH